MLPASLKKVFRNREGKHYRAEIPGFIAFIALYGLALNYVFSALLGAEFNAGTFLAYGLAWYFIKVEAVRLIHLIRR